MHAPPHPRGSYFGSVPSSPAVQLSSLARFDSWQRRIDFRRAVRRARTLSGAVLIVFVLVSAPSIFELMRDGPVTVADVSSLSVLGALMIAHVSFAAAFAAVAWLSFATGLVLRFQHAPLRAHSAVLPVALFHEVVVVGVARTALVTLFFLYGLHWRLLRTVMTSPIEWALHFVLMVMMLAAIGAFLFSRARRTILRASDPRNRAMTANKSGVFGAMFALLGGFAAEAAFAQKAPWLLERIGEASAMGAVILVPPLHAVTSTSWVPGLAWLLVGTLSTVVLWLEAARSAPDWVLELPVDHEAAPPFTPARLRSVIRGRGAVRRASAFAAKDLLLPVLRAPARHFLQQWFAFSAAALILVVLSFAMPEVKDTESLLILPVLAGLHALIQAPLATLHLLGMEGRQIALLIPMLPARTLLALKGAPALIFVILHSVIGTLLLLVLAFALGYSDIPVAGTLAVAIIGGAVAAALGVAMGFLFPDFERRSVASPGATLVGRFGFMAVAGMALSIFAILLSMVQAGSLPRPVFPASVGILITLVAVFTIVIGLVAVKRLSRVEI